MEDILEEEKALDEYEQETLDNLGKFIKYNKSLQELNISHCQIKFNLLRELLSCLRRSKSLLVINVNGNPGVTDELRHFIHEKIHCKEDPYDLERFNYI